MNCKDCQNYELYKMITSEQGYGYTGDIPCIRCKWYHDNDEFVPEYLRSKMKGKITGTCGHIISDEWLNKGAIVVKDQARDGSPAQSHRLVCKECLKWYKKEKLIVDKKDVL